MRLGKKGKNVEILKDASKNTKIKMCAYGRDFAWSPFHLVHRKGSIA